MILTAKISFINTVWIKAIVCFGLKICAGFRIFTRCTIVADNSTIFNRLSFKQCYRIVQFLFQENTVHFKRCGPLVERGAPIGNYQHKTGEA